MQLSDEKELEEGNRHGQDGYRYFIMIMYILAAIIMGMATNPLTPISETTESTYSVSKDKITLTTTANQLANILMSFPAVKLASNLGVRGAMTIGTFMIAVGFLLRAFININYYFVAVGQVIAGFGCPLINIIAARVVTDWFNKSDRGVWLALASLAPVLGVLAGFVTPLFFIADSKVTSIEKQKSNIRNYLGFEFIMMGCLFVVVTLCWRSSPGTQEDDNKEVMLNSRETFVINDPAEATISSLMKQITICLSRPAVRAMFIINGLGFGMMTVIGSLITPILACFSYPEYYGPLIAVVVILSGLVASLLYSAYLLNHRYQYRNKYWFTGATTIFFCGLCMSVIYKSSITVVLISSCLVGMPGIALTVLVIEEIIRRVHGNFLLTATILNSVFSQAFAATVTYITGFFLEAGNEYNGSLIMLAFAGCFTTLFFYCFIAENNLIHDDQRKKSIKEQMILDSASSHGNE